MSDIAPPGSPMNKMAGLAEAFAIFSKYDDEASFYADGEDCLWIVCVPPAIVVKSDTERLQWLGWGLYAARPTWGFQHMTWDS